MACHLGHYGGVFADGERMVVESFDGLTVEIARPMLRDISIESHIETYQDRSGYGVEFCSRSPVVTATIIGNSSIVSYGKMPDVSRQADELTVTELFALIEKKLKERG